MAPPLSLFELALEFTVSVGLTDQEVCESVAVAVGVELAVELITLDDALPKICCNGMYGRPSAQQSVS